MAADLWFLFVGAPPFSLTVLCIAKEKMHTEQIYKGEWITGTAELP